MGLAESSVKRWHPWPLNQLELLQGTAFTTPYREHFAQDYVLGTVQSGTVLLHYRDTSYEVSDNTIYIIEPGEIWACQAKRLTFQHLHIDPAWLHHIAAEIVGNAMVFPHFPHHCLLDPELSTALQNIYSRLISPTSRLQQQEMLLSVLAKLLSYAEYKETLRTPSSSHTGVKRIKAYLEEHYAEEISLEDLAGVANLSAFHLSRIFRQSVGLPPHAYQTQIRIDHARILLAQGLPVGYVASETGFFDQAHFTHQFKQHLCMTPGHYLKSARFYKYYLP